MTGPEERTTQTGPDATASGPAERNTLTRHWDSLDGEAAALLGAVERNLERNLDLDRGSEEDRRPIPLGGEAARPRLNGPSRVSATPERPKRWITAVLVAGALTMPFATPAGNPAPRAPAGGSASERGAE